MGYRLSISDPKAMGLASVAGLAAWKADDHVNSGVLIGEIFDGMLDIALIQQYIAFIQHGVIFAGSDFHFAVKHG